MGYFTKINESFKEVWEILRNFGAQSKEYQNLVESTGHINLKRSFLRILSRFRSLQGWF